MKKILIVLMLLVSLTVFASCKGGNTTENTEKPVNTANRTPTPVKTATPTPAPTDTPAPSPKPLSEDQKGKPQQDAEELYRDEFKDNELNELAVTRADSPVIFIDNEEMKMSHDGTDYVDSWDIYSPDMYLEVGETHNQYEFYVDLSTTFTDPNSVWMACFLGARVTDTTTTGIANDPNSGFWVAITKDYATVYPGTDGQWPGGKLKITLPEAADTKHTYLIVDDGTKLYYYMFKADGERVLLLSADVSGEDVKVYDAQGTEVLTCPNSIQESTGGYFKLFNHMGHTVVDNIIVKGSR